ncbi:DsbC family protein [Thauera aromatica]|uniref:DsbC family protein n=1 Tax=Thauera aromatica TaxID=59405 RepID=UPI001FFCA0C0|nr:DsbC family protein [Thauera aromatica]MCK2087236.1 DsbC family protein [Thauera aromatica]MCK2128096.1 DsbC family protein [Thauera aromatica]
MSKFFALFLATGLAGFTHAGEAEVKKGMEAFIGAPAVESVARTGYGGLYEVVLKNGQLVYTDAETRFIIDGSLIDTATRLDVTQARMNQLSAIDFSTLPLEQAVKLVKGKGTRVIATFEDPNCSYCKRLAQEVARMDDVTVYTFLYPILGEDSTLKSTNIWCAKGQGRAQAWTDWMVDGKVPEKADCDASAITRNVELGRSLRINGTPTIFLANGTRIGGYIPAAELEKALDKPSR